MKGEKDSNAYDESATLEELYKAKTTKPSAPPMESSPPPSEYYFGSDEHYESLQLDADRKSTTEFEWYNADGWRIRARAGDGNASEQNGTEGSSEEEVHAELSESRNEEVLTDLDQGNAFEKVLADLREENNISAEKTNLNAADADEMEADTPVLDKSDEAKNNATFLTEEKSSEYEEVQQGQFKSVSDFAWNTYLPGPWNNS